MSTQTPQQYPNNPYSPQATQNKAGGGAPPSSGGGGWKWLIIILAILGIGAIVCCGACGGLAYFGADAAKGVIKDLPPYKMAMEKVRGTVEVKDKLGQPITDDLEFNGLQFDGKEDSGSANFNINVAGPNGKATVRVSATNAGGDNWTLQDCTVRFADGTTAQLADAEVANPAADGAMEEGGEAETETEDATSAPE